MECANKTNKRLTWQNKNVVGKKKKAELAEIS